MKPMREWPWPLLLAAHIVAVFVGPFIVLATLLATLVAWAWRKLLNEPEDA